jgi:hypothetical protein
MFFIRCGVLIAWFLILLGVLRTGAGLLETFFASALELSVAPARYLSAAAAGDAISGGMIMVVAGVVMGLLVQIAKGVTFE